MNTRPHLPAQLPGHWMTAEGHEMAVQYANGTRGRLAGGHMTDMEAAFHVAMTMRDDLGHEGRLAVGKDRIRFLSAQLAVRDMELAHARLLLSDSRALIDEAITTHIYDEHDEVPNDCAYTAASVEIEAFLLGTLEGDHRPPQIVVSVAGGMVEEVFYCGLRQRPDVLVVDSDTQDQEDAHEVTLNAFTFEACVTDPKVIELAERFDPDGPEAEGDGDEG